ncbi:MAG TPA: hypothetical protein PK443_02055 [bacterium]|nr:hypothetical protein [bacterium]
MIYLISILVFVIAFIFICSIVIYYKKIKRNAKRINSLERKILWRIPKTYSYIYRLFPRFCLKILTRTRGSIIEKELLVLLDNIACDLSAGYSIIETMNAVTKKIKAPLCNEVNFFLVIQKSSGTVNAIQSCLKRSDNVFLKLMWNILLTYYKNGGAVCDNIRKLHNSIYTRLIIKNRIKAQLMQNKIQVIAGTILPYLLFVVMGMLYPELMSQVPHSRIGIGIIFFAVLLHVIGIFFFIRVTKFNTQEDLNTCMMFEYLCFSIKNGVPVLQAIKELKDFNIVNKELLNIAIPCDSTSEFIEKLETSKLKPNQDLFTMLKRSHSMGAKIAEDLSFKAKDFLEKLENKALMFQQTVSAKALVPMLFCIFPATYLMILCPIIVEISNSQI